MLVTPPLYHRRSPFLPTRQTTTQNSPSPCTIMLVADMESSTPEHLAAPPAKHSLTTSLRVTSRHLDLDPERRKIIGFGGGAKTLSFRCLPAEHHGLIGGVGDTPGKNGLTPPLTPISWARSREAVFDFERAISQRWLSGAKPVLVVWAKILLVASAHHERGTEP